MLKTRAYDHGVRRIALLAFLALAGCAPAAKPPIAPTEALEEIEVQIIGIAVKVPEKTEVSFVGAGATFFTRPDDAIDQRAFSVEEWPAGPVHDEPAGPKQVVVLDDGAEVQYVDQQLAPDEAALTGALTIHGVTFAIHCHGVKEKPEWCLQYLGTLRLTHKGLD